MKNKNFYNIVSKTKLVKVFEGNKVMYETYFGIQGPGPGPEPEPTLVDMQITGAPPTAVIGTPVKQVLQVTLFYDDGSTRELAQDEYTTNKEFIEAGFQAVTAYYLDFNSSVNIIGVEPEPEPIFARNYADINDFDEFTTASPFNAGDYVDYTVYKRNNNFSQSKQDDYMHLYTGTTTSSDRYGIVFTQAHQETGKYEYRLKYQQNGSGHATSEAEALNIYFGDGSTDLFRYQIVVTIYGEYFLRIYNTATGKTNPEFTLDNFTIGQLDDLRVLVDLDAHTAKFNLNGTDLYTLAIPTTTKLGYLNIAGPSNNGLKATYNLDIYEFAFTEVE